MTAVAILTPPTMSDSAGLRTAYVTRAGDVTLISGAGAWTFPNDGWRLRELERMATALSVILSDDSIVLLQHRYTGHKRGCSMIVALEPLRDKHLMPLVESGRMTPMEALRALAWTYLNPLNPLP